MQEIQLNIAYRWFCGFELADKIPDHSTFSKTRLRKWNESQLFQQVFLEIVRRCVKSGLVDGKELAADGTYLPANVSRDSWIETEVEAELSMQSYLDRLDEELSKQPGFKKPSIKTIKKRRTTSKTDPDSGCINHGKKSGIGYLMETTVDCKCGIITGVDVYPANEKESLLVLRHLERQIQNGVPMQNIALDRGYDTGAVHRGLELLGITGYIPAIQFSNSPEKYGFVYLPQEDAFCCPEGARLVYQRLNCSQTTGKYLRCYQVQGETCKHCKRKSVCFKQTGIRRRILGSSCYPAFYRGHERIGSDAYWHMMRLRKIWAEGSFSVLKREHCLSKIRKRGILAVTEECLLSAMALNLKRMVKAILLFLYKPRMWVENIVFCPIFHFCQQVLNCTQNIRPHPPKKNGNRPGRNTWTSAGYSRIFDGETPLIIFSCRQGQERATLLFLLAEGERRMLFLDVPYQQKGCAIHAPPCCETWHRVQIKKRSQNAQPQNEILCSKGAWGRCPQQADGRKCECVLTLALLAGFVCGYPHALLASV